MDDPQNVLVGIEDNSLKVAPKNPRLTTQKRNPDRLAAYS